jgi:tetratricopeptide (TPR) repeat protein
VGKIAEGSRMRITLTVSAVLFLACSIAFADTVYLTDGTVKEGKVIEVTEKQVRLQVKYGGSVGEVTIPREKVSRIVTSKPDPAKVRQDGYDLLAKEAFTDAIAAFKEALRLQPASADAHADLGLACTLARRFTEAAEAYKKAAELAPGTPDFLLGLGHAYQQLGKLNSAIETYTAYTKKKPRDAAGFRLLAEAYMGKKSYVQAIASAKTAVSVNEGDVQSRMLLARLYWELELLDPALKEADTAVKLAPKLAEAYMLRAQILLDADRKDAAAADLKKAAEHNNNADHPAENIASASEKQDKTETPPPADAAPAGQPAPAEKPAVAEQPQPVAQETEKAPEKKMAGDDAKKPERELKEVCRLLDEALRRLRELKASQEKPKPAQDK